MKKTLYIIGLLSLLWSCSEHENMTGDQHQLPISISSSYPSASVGEDRQSPTTRTVIDGGFVAGDETGIFIVDYAEDGQVGEVLMRGNRASNMRFSLQENGLWQAPTQLYWADNQTPADFYGYYPFDDAMNSATDYAFAVAANQAGDDSRLSSAGYTKSDLLRAKAEKVKPTAETINLAYKHLMAGVTIRLEQGTGFTNVEWAAFDKTVILKNTVLSGSVNLVDGTTMVSNGSIQTIKPLYHEGVWRGVVFPQTVTAGKPVIIVTVDGQGYQLENNAGLTFVSGKMHVFTITVNRRTGSGQFEFVLSSEAITPWLDDTELHEGLVRDYLLVKVDNAGTLKSCIQALGYDYREVSSMKVSGMVNRHDLSLMGDSMPSLINLNLKDIRIVADEKGNGADVLSFRNDPEWHNYLLLSHIVLPDHITAIAEKAFMFTRLRGSLNIPEGVTTIGSFAFFDCSFTGTLTLPSTLKRIEDSAFSFNSFTGELTLPENVEYIALSDYPVFSGSRFSGTLLLPSKLERLFPIDCSRMTGTLVIPQGMTEIPGVCYPNSGFNEVVIPEGITKIGGGAFAGANLCGELVLPSTLETIGGNAFNKTKITKVIFPDNLRVMEDGAPMDFRNAEGVFSHCTRLMGVLEFPKNVARVPKQCFAGCAALEGVVFSKNVDIIDEQAFAGCAMLNSIVCENPEPPTICKDAFLGVPKDNFTVEVPKGCVEKYKQASGWREFKRISEYSNFVCRPAQAQALNQIHQETLVLNADADWKVEHQPEWCTLSQTQGIGKTQLTVTFQKLSHGQGNRRDSIIFRLNGTEGFTTYCVLKQYDYEYEEDAYLTLQQHTRGNGINIVFAGDGWDGQTISDGSYLDLVKYQTESFFAIEPYKSMRDYFNVYVTFPLSQERGVNTMYTYVNNHFGTLQGSSAIDATSSAQLITETDNVLEYVTQKTPVTNDVLYRTVIILVPNATEYEGNTLLMDNGFALSICPPSENPYPRDTRGTIQHEAGGHGFGKLGDEAIKSGRCGYGFIPECIANQIREMQWRGWYQNLSLSGKLHDVGWSEFIFDPVYSDYVDVYEGGYGYMRGVFRPEANSCMNYGIPYYNTPSRLSIWKRIKEYAGETWTMEEFRAQDTFEWGATEITRSQIAPTVWHGYAESNRHVIPAIVDFKKMGRNVRTIRAKTKIMRK